MKLWNCINNVFVLPSCLDLCFSGYEYKIYDLQSFCPIKLFNLIKSNSCLTVPSCFGLRILLLVMSNIQSFCSKVLKFNSIISSNRCILTNNNNTEQINHFTRARARMDFESANLLLFLDAFYF